MLWSFDYYLHWSFTFYSHSFSFFLPVFEGVAATLKNVEKERKKVDPKLKQGQVGDKLEGQLAACSKVKVSSLAIESVPLFKCQSLESVRKNRGLFINASNRQLSIN